MIRFIFVIFTGMALALSAKHLQVELNADAAILMNADSGAILFEKNSRKQYFPASTTKIATALYTLSKADLQLEKIIVADRESLASITPKAKSLSNYAVPAYWLDTDGTHIGIKNEEQISLHDLLYGMLVASGNDAANLIAKEIGGTIPNFVQELNAYLKELGCQDTLFYNPHGLHHPKHLTTAFDMALIAKEALNYPLFQKIVISERFMRPKTNKQAAFPLMQTNHLVRKGKPAFYNKAIGIKTGYVAAAQHTLVAAAREGDRTLIGVVFKCKNKQDSFNAAIKLFEAAFNQPKVERLLLKKGQEYFFKMPGAVKPIQGILAEDLSIEYYPAEEPALAGEVRWREFTLPVTKGQIVADIRIIDAGGEIIRMVPLLAAETVKKSWFAWPF